MKPTGNKINHKPYKFPDEKNGIKIVEHLDFEPKAKRYVIARCNKCGSDWRTRFDSLKEGVLCRRCSNINGAKKRITHGLTLGNKQHPIYAAYHGMIQRCDNSNSRANKWYLNVKISEEWRNSFDSFFNWAMANGWKEGLELDKDLICNIRGGERIYSKETCLWITPSLNKRIAYEHKRKISLNNREE